MNAVDDEPGSRTLVRLFLEHNDGAGALRACSLWREREPGCPEIPACEAQARGLGGWPRPLAVDQRHAERYVQQGLLPEALEVFRRLEAAGALDEDGHARLVLLEDFVRFVLPLDAEPAQLSAEEHVANRRLPTALLAYRELARENPTDEDVIRRAEQLRSLVLGVPWAVRQEAEELARTAEMPLSTKALLMLEEGNLGIASQLFRVLASAGGSDELVGRLAAALARLEELAGEGPPAASFEDEGTVRLGPTGFAAFHVRVGNFAEAAQLYRALVEEQPTNGGLRRRLEDLQTVLEYLRREKATPPEPPRPPERRRRGRTSQIGLGSKTPDPQRALGKRSGAYELSAFRPPDGESEQSGAGPGVDAEPTKRVDKRELAELQLARGFVERALILFDELLAERPSDRELAARVADLRARFAAPLVPEEDEQLATHVDRPVVRSPAVDDLRPQIDPEAMVDVLRAAPVEAEPLRSASSWLPTQRMQAVDRAPGLDDVPSELRRRWARTELSRPPTVEEVEGSSIVEVPRNLASVVERTPGRLDADEAAEVAEPLGVLVRPVLLIE